jgi:YVTN family beta-propeller protein
VHPDGATVYVATLGSGTVSVIDTATNTVVDTVAVELSPVGVAVHPDGTTVYVANQFSGTVSVIDTATNTVVDTVTVEGFPYGVAVHPDGTTVYVSTVATGTVSVIDTATNTVVDTVTVGLSPMSVAVHPNGGAVYVANQFSGTVSVVDTATNRVVDTVTMGYGPAGVAVHPDGSSVYVANEINDTVPVIDTATNTVVDTVTVGSGPKALGQFIRPTSSDNCLLTVNPGQENHDSDAEGDACDPDDDNDGVPDATDVFPLDGTEWLDTDGDGIGNNADGDDDNDGVADTFESDNGFNPFDSVDAGADSDGDTFSNLDEFLAGSDPGDVGSTPLSQGGAFVQDHLTGFWHSYAYFDNATSGNDPGWNLCSLEFDPAGAIASGGCLDADDVSAPLNGSAALADNGALTPTGEWVEGVSASHYRLDIGKTVLAGVATRVGGGDELPSLDLTAKEGSGYLQDDLAGTWRRFRYADSEGGSSDPRWTYGHVGFDAAGLIIDSGRFDSAAPVTPLAPWDGSATLKPDGEVVPAGDWVSTHTAFSLSMDAGKTVVTGVATRDESGTTVQDHQLWVKQGSAYTQSDLEGTWNVYDFSDSSSGTQVPGWARLTLVTDATGTVVDGSGVDSEGTLQPHEGTLTLDADGKVTLNGALAATLLFQELRMDAGRTVFGGVLSVDLDGEPFEKLIVAVKSGSAGPEILSPITGSVLPGASATWKWSDNGSLVTDWWLTVGTSIGASDRYNSGSLPAVSREHTVSGLPTAGETVFVRLSYQEDGVWLFTDMQYTASPSP